MILSNIILAILNFLIVKVIRTEDEYFKFYGNLTQDDELMRRSPFFNYSDMNYQMLNNTILKMYQGDMWNDELTRLDASRHFTIYQPFDQSNLTRCVLKLDWLKDAFRRHQIRSVVKVAFLDGSNVGLLCPLCVSGLKFVHWFRRNSASSTYHYIGNVNDERIFSLKDVLFIRDFNSHIDAGFYFCTRNYSPEINDTFFDLDKVRDLFKIEYFLYQLETFDREPSLVVDENTKTERGLDTIPKSKLKSWTNEQAQLTVYTMWNEWSKCSVCGFRNVAGAHKGFRKRSGECRIKFKRNNLTEFNARLDEIDRLFYPNGWSCYTDIIVRFVSWQQFTSFYEFFQDYIHYEICSNEPCFDQANLKDLFEKNQFIIENDKHFSLANYVMPEINVHRTSVRRFKGESVTLVCLDRKFTGFEQQAIEWEKDNLLVNKEITHVLSNSRSNVLQEFEIKELNFKDTGVYKCYMNGKLLAVVELTVETNAFADSNRYKYKYDLYDDYLTFLFKIVTALTLFLTLTNLINSWLYLKQLTSKRVESKKQHFDLYNYIRLNVSHFEKQIFSQIGHINENN